MLPGQCVHWVAHPPPGALPPPNPPRLTRYLGPPAYRTTPGWGFPPLAWRRPTSVPGTTQAPPTVERVVTLARVTMVALLVLAVFAVLAAGGEVWRYVLLLRSRGGALTRGVVDASDFAVVSSSVLAIVLAFIAAVLTLWWLSVIRRAAGEAAGYEPPRPDWQVLALLLIPGVNLAVGGSVLAELEHAVNRRSILERPRPSRLLVGWWVAWAVGGVVFAATLLWRLRTGVQARADGVLLSAVTDLLAAGVAVLTVLVVHRLTVLLSPVNPRTVRRMRVIRVEGAPEPPLRAVRVGGSPR